MDSFFCEKISGNSKKIGAEEAGLIASLVEDHPYYCQQLAQIAWLRTDDICTKEIIEKSHIVLTEQLSLLFENITENLTSQQICYLKAVLNGETTLSSTNVMEKYGISSSTSVLRSREALIKKDILDKAGKEVNFLDPVYKFWLKKKYFA